MTAFFIFLTVALAYIRVLVDAQAVACGNGRPEVVGELSYNGYFWSPGYPQNYPNDAWCDWRITVPYENDTYNTVVRLDFEAFSTEFGYDFLRIYDGNSVVAPMIRSISGSQPVASISSGGPAMYISFKTDGIVTDRGFFAKYNTDPACAPGGIRRLRDGDVAESPYYPYNYPVDETCHWYSYNDGLMTNFKINFTAFSLEQHPNCYLDELTIDIDGTIVGRFCGETNSPGIVFLTGYEVRVYFRSDKSMTSSGFQFQVTFDEVITTTPAHTTPSTTTSLPAGNIKLSLRIMVNGTIQASSAITETCADSIKQELYEKALGIAQDINDRLRIGQICDFDTWRLTNWIVNFHPSGSTGTMRLDFFMPSLLHRVVMDNDQCSLNINTYLQDHGNWIQPIIPPLPGCPAVINFVPSRFDYYENMWFCEPVPVNL